MKTTLQRICAALLCLAMVAWLGGCARITDAIAGRNAGGEVTLPAQEETVPEKEVLIPVTQLTRIPDAEWQCALSFPDWRDTIDTTLAVNGSYSFKTWEGQGILYLDTTNCPSDFRLYINGTAADVSEVAPGGYYTVDFSRVAVNGINTLQVSGLETIDRTSGDNEETGDALRIRIPYPVVTKGDLTEEGFSEEAFRLISDLIETDCAYGFPGAQLAVISHGKLIYENAWGKTNAYLPDGTYNTASPDITTDTLFDLASVTKMFAVNYALQKLVSDGVIDVDAPVTKYLGDAFVTETADIRMPNGANPDIDTMQEWKGRVTVRDLMCHQAGLPADPRYFHPSEALFSGNDATWETRDLTREMMLATPLLYEPRTDTMYSDADYMILGLIVEEVTHERLDLYVQRNFYVPMGLTHITFNPLQNGFAKDDCAATELNGNTRDGYVSFDGIRTETVQGEVHDEKAYYSMAGVSGHAGLFSNATDLAILASAMLTGGYGDFKFFSENVMDLFTSPKSEEYANWGLGWYRQAEHQRVWYFGTQASSATIGHQGWTGTMVMIDPARDLVVVYLTHAVNSPVTNARINANRFDGGFYTASTLGFVPQILSIGTEGGEDVSAQLNDLLLDMTDDSYQLITDDLMADDMHPLIRNAHSKMDLLLRYAEQSEDETFVERAGQMRLKWASFDPEEET